MLLHIISHRSPAFTSSLRTINSIINNAKYCAASQTCCCCCRETLMGRHEKYHRTTRSLEALASSLDIRSIIHWINMQTKVSEQKNVKERKRKKKNRYGGIVSPLQQRATSSRAINCVRVVVNFPLILFSLKIMTRHQQHGRSEKTAWQQEQKNISVLWLVAGPGRWMGGWLLSSFHRCPHSSSLDSLFDVTNNCILN